MKNAADGNATVNATCVTMTPVQTPPNLSPPPPADDWRRRVSSPRPVALSAGTIPAIAAPSTVNKAA